MKHAAIEIGSAALQLMIMNDEGQIICDESRDIGLGMGQGGLLPTERVEDAIAALAELVEIARLHEVPVWRIQSVASCALRRAFNSKSIIKRIHSELGLETYLLNTEEEGKLAWKGAICGLTLPEGPTAVVDIGGSFIEAVSGIPTRMLQFQTFHLGYMSLTEQFFGRSAHNYSMPQVSKMKHYIDDQLSRLQWQTRPRILVAAGSAAMAIASMERGLLQHNPAEIHGLRLSRGILRKWSDRLLERTAQNRKTLCPAYPNKVDYLLAACCVLESICTYSLRDSLLISGGGLRLGVLISD
ncbi:MAG: hypothetical protein VX278_10330 [Myxococcota bacterium]|nr:hypothetical protein [Myxococcota bacterium]